MSNLNKHCLPAFVKRQDGLAAVEYAVAGALVVGAMIGAFLLLGTNASDQMLALAAIVSP